MQTLSNDILLAYTNMNAIREMEKEVVEAACWNWALYGVRPLPLASPATLYGYVNRGAHQIQTRADADAVFVLNTPGTWNNLQPAQPLRVVLDDIRAEYDASADNTATRNRIRDAVFELSLQAAGFELSAAQTPYRVCMFEPGDVVMFDHWWLEITGAVAETVTGDPLYGYSNRYLAPAFNHPRNRYASRAQPGGLSVDMQARVHARYVTRLQDAQAGYLELLAAM